MKTEFKKLDSCIDRCSKLVERRLEEKIFYRKTSPVPLPAVNTFLKISKDGELLWVPIDKQSELKTDWSMYAVDGVVEIYGFSKGNGKVLMCEYDEPIGRIAIPRKVNKQNVVGNLRLGFVLGCGEIIWDKMTKYLAINFPKSTVIYLNEKVFNRFQRIGYCYFVLDQRSTTICRFYTCLIHRHEEKR